MPKDGGTASYQDLINIAIENRPQAGFSIQEMRSRLRIQDAVEKVESDVLHLEDQDAEKLQECVKAMTWGLLHKDIVQFCDDIEGMKNGQDSNN